MREKITLAMVDDHQIVLDGIHSLLKDEPHFEFAFSTTNPVSVLQQLEEKSVDILLTDIMMPKMTGNVLAKEVRTKFPAIKILALSMSGEDDLVSEMINDADISGYVLKNIGKEQLVLAIEKIAAGGIYFSDEILEALQRTERRKVEIKQVHLSDREIEIIRLIEKELSNRQIAAALFISERTVETHRKNIFRKTGSNSLIGLIKFAYEHRLI
ncbi:MAG: response regulator transcription factor [Chitinophagaceae bacterium]|nr:MAG: response regulator transcription factor [Chitinophagaceae bacterium]